MYRYYCNYIHLFQFASGIWRWECKRILITHLAFWSHVSLLCSLCRLSTASFRFRSQYVINDLLQIAGDNANNCSNIQKLLGGPKVNLNINFFSSEN